MKLALSVTHAPWLPDRRQCLTRLLGQLGVVVSPEGSAWGACAEAEAAGLSYVHLETTPGPNWKWGEAQWAWAASTDADVCVFTQDDQEVPGDGDFWPILRAMLEANPHRLIGLHTRHPEAAVLAAAGRHWLSTTEMVGTGYAFWRDDGPDSLKRFLDWRRQSGDAWVRKIDEDTSIGEGWAKMTGRRIWHPIPTIIDHDLDLPSTADNDRDPDRRPTVTWQDVETYGWSTAQLKSRGFWETGLADAPHFIANRIAGERPVVV